MTIIHSRPALIFQAIPPHEPLDTSAARSRAELASRGGLALRQSPSQGLLRRSGGAASMSSNSSLERSIEESRIDLDSITESAGNCSQDSIQFHEAYFASRWAVTTTAISHFLGFVHFLGFCSLTVNRYSSNLIRI